MASFSTENDSIVSGGMLLSIWLVISTPSRISSGDCPEPKVEMPRIQKFAPSAPGSPVFCTAILPANEVERLLDDTCNSLGLTDWTAPTSDSFFCTPKPTTTTSSNSFEASTSVTSLKSSLSLTAIFFMS